MTYKLSQEQIRAILRYIEDSDVRSSLGSGEKIDNEIKEQDEISSIFSSILTVMELAEEDYVYIQTKQPY